MFAYLALVEDLIYNSSDMYACNFLMENVISCQ